MSVRILNGDCRDVLKTLPDESVHCVVTSPPYWRQRDYDHESQIGQEETPEDYVASLVETVSEVRRLLKPDGSLWLNISDCYSSGGRGGHRKGRDFHHHNPRTSEMNGWIKAPPGFKDKDLIGLSWMTALGLQADGWYLRSANIWAKANGMPDSAPDRPAPAHEYVFQLSKNQRYFYDAEAVKLPAVPESVERLARQLNSQAGDEDLGPLVISGGGYSPPGQAPHQGARRSDKQRGLTRRHAGFNDRWDAMSLAEQQGNGAGLRSVWWLSPAQFRGAHFAVMPVQLAALCILAGCPEGGLVLDPFGGAGTVGLVADRLKRDALLIELNPEYVEIAQRRIEQDAGMFAEVDAA